MEQLRAQISGFRHIETKTDQSWIYYVGGGLGSGLLLLLVMDRIVYLCGKRPRYDLARQPVSVTYTTPESQNMMQTRHMVNDNDMQQTFATALLNKLQGMGADVTGHCRRLNARQATGPQLEILP